METFEIVNNETGFNYKNNEEINWFAISKYPGLSEDFISKFSDKVYWDEISKFQKLSENFMERYKYKLNWFNINFYQDFSEEFIERNYNEFNKHYLCAYHKLSEEFIEKHLSNFYNSVAEFQKLSYKFIERHKDVLSWMDISRHQFLSEEFIENNRFLVHWTLICKYQRLSEEFLERNFNFLSMFDISKFQKLSDKFIENHKSYLFIELIRDNWIYKTSEEKKQVVINTGKYECYDDYFIAYKAIRPDRYSLYNFQYKYEKGGIYESWCDCSDNEDSFGLSVGTSNFVNMYGLTYLKYQVVRCKVRYEDVGRIVRNGDKIRCFKIEILD